jgi:hypothetical protein
VQARSPNGAGTPILPIPLSGARAVRRVAVVGPNANATQSLLGNYSPVNVVVNNQSVLMGVQRRAAAAGVEVSYAPGCEGVACNGTSGFAAAVALAQAADVAIVVLGLCSSGCPGGDADSPYSEGEGHDRVSLLLPNEQEALLAAVVASGTPTVLLLVHGGPVDISASKKTAPAILSLFYPGQMGGDAAAALLFGDVSPSGRSLYTWYPQAFAAQRLVVDMQLAPHANASTNTTIPGITYMFYEGGDALWPFGWGLSYASFNFSWMAGGGISTKVTTAVDAARAGGVPPFAVNVTNTGGVCSGVSALAFLAPSGPPVPGEPLSELFDFQRVASLCPGQSAVLYFTVPPPVLAAFSARHNALAVRPGAYEIRIGDVREGAAAIGSLVVTGEDDVPLPKR